MRTSVELDVKEKQSYMRKYRNANNDHNLTWKSSHGGDVISTSIIFNHTGKPILPCFLLIYFAMTRTKSV